MAEKWWWCRGCKAWVPESQVAALGEGLKHRHWKSPDGCGFSCYPDGHALAPKAEPAPDDLNQAFISPIGKELARLRAENAELRAQLANIRPDSFP